MKQTESCNVFALITAITILDQDRLIIARFDGIIEIRKISTGKKLHGWIAAPPVNDWYKFICFLLPTTKGTLVSVTEEGSAKEWNLDYHPAVIWEHEYGVHEAKSMIELPNGSFLAKPTTAFISLKKGFAWGADDGNIHISSVKEGKRVGEKVVCLARHQDMVAAGLADGTVTLLHVADWNVIWTVKMYQQSMWVVTWSPDGHLIVTASMENNDIRINSRFDGTVLKTIHGYIFGYNSLVVSPEGNKIIMASGPSLVIERLYMDLEIRMASLVYQSSFFMSKKLFSRCKRFYL